MTDTVRAYKFYNARWGLDALFRQRLKLSTSDDINDPFEFLATGPNKASRAEAKRVRNELFSEAGLISFSANWSEPVLWSHYADNHRGLVLGFDLPKEICFPVCYTDERIQIPSNDPNKYKFGDRIKFMERIRVTKFSAWNYENEIRVFPDFRGSVYENGLCFRPFEDIGRLKQVIIGADYRSRKNEKLTKNLHDLGIEILTARLAFKSFSVTKQDANRMKKKL